MEEAIKKAIKGGYIGNHPHHFKHANKYWALWIDENGGEYTTAIQVYLLDPTFWQSLGKSLGWSEDLELVKYPESKNIGEWELQWHRFIDHLTEGKDPELFFKNLLK